MPNISDAALAKMRALVNEMLPDSGVIEAVSLTPDAAGGNAETWTPVSGGTVAIRLDPVNSRNTNRIEFSAETMLESYQVTLPHDAPIVAHNRLVSGGNTYQIVQLDNGHSWNVSRRAVAVRII